VTIPNEFTANTTDKASEVNANFTAVKTAVDGNAADITTNATDIATNKANITTNGNAITTNATAITANANAIAGTITGVDARGGLAGGGTSGDVNLSLSATSIPINASAFESKSETGDNCELRRDVDKIYFATTSTSGACKAYASVPIPNNATITAVSCLVTHDDGTDDTVIKLQEVYPHRITVFSPYSMTTHTAATLTYDSTSSDMVGKYADASLHTSTLILLDGLSSFVLEYEPSNPSGAGDNESLHACHIFYEFK
jgi:hypothetical protein